MDGHIFRQSSSYRQGLVLGLTMAEIMILLIFCLLITMATFLKREQTKREEAEQQVRVERVSSMADRNLVTAIRQNPELYERLRSDVVTSSGVKAVDEFWRELVESRNAMADLKKGGLSEKNIRDQLADMERLKSKGISLDKALRDAEIVGSIEVGPCRRPVFHSAANDRRRRQPRAFRKPGRPPMASDHTTERSRRKLFQDWKRRAVARVPRETAGFDARADRRTAQEIRRRCHRSRRSHR